MTATSTELWHVVVWRFVSGMGIGADIAGLTAYLSEVSPKRLRGRYTSIAVGCGFLGIAVVPFVAGILVPDYAWGWRALFVIGGVGGIMIAWGRRGLAPSPRWLLIQGRREEALATVEAAERYVVEKRGVALPEVEPAEPMPSPTSALALLRSPLNSRLIFFVLIWGLYYVGNYAWLSLMPELYVKHGLKLSSSLWLTGITSLGLVLGSVLAVFMSDHLERKWVCAGVALFWGLCLLVVGWMPSVTVVTVAGFFASASISLFIPVMYTYTGESFPTAVRATSVATTDGVGHVGGMFCAPIVWGSYRLFETGGHGYQAALTTMALTGLLAAVLLLFGRRTRGAAL
jgi:putative MFS transporter